MLLYELTSPTENKYGGFLTAEELARCTKQTELSPRWTPYPKRPARVENICGKFVVRVGCADESTATGLGCATVKASGEGSSCASLGGGSGEKHDEHLAEANSAKYVSCLSGHHMDRRLDSVCFRTDSPFGRQFELFHVAGHVTVRSTPGLARSVIFKGVKGVSGTRELLRDLFLDGMDARRGIDRAPSVLPLVHMGVMSCCIGERLQTSHGCYLENKVSSGVGSMQGGWMRVEPRSMDQCNIVRLAVHHWHSLLPEHLMPTSNDIVITGKGSVMHRMSWPGVVWTEENERVVLDVCTWVAEQIAAVC